MTNLNNPTTEDVLDLAHKFGPQHVFEGEDKGYKYSARVDLWLIARAWSHGANFEPDADGFGPGLGTMGDWSAIRDSSDEAVAKMYRKALALLSLKA